MSTMADAMSAAIKRRIERGDTRTQAPEEKAELAKKAKAMLGYGKPDQNATDE
jgi:hypothetical protein